LSYRGIWSNQVKRGTAREHLQVHNGERQDHHGRLRPGAPIDLDPQACLSALMAVQLSSALRYTDGRRELNDLDLVPGTWS
jgi:hypothetical protein